MTTKKSKPSLEEGIARCREYLKRNPITPEMIAAFADAEEAARCPKCSRVILCGVNRLCGEPDCPQK